MESNEQATRGHEALKATAEAKLAGKRGKRYWRSLEELSDSPEFQNFLEDEFPNRSTISQINRRDLLKFMGASLALAGISGCRGVFLPQDKVVPYVKQPEELVPGKPLFYATSIPLAGYVTGVLVEQHEGRPIKIEGNPEHPASLGAIDAISQAEVLGFYDPDRAGNVLSRLQFGYEFDGDLSTWRVFDDTMREILRRQRPMGGAGIRILTGSFSSPTLARLIDAFRTQYPGARWHAYEPVGRANVHAATRATYGQALEPIYDFRGARVVLSLDGDFLSPTAMPGTLRYAREFVDGRRVKGTSGEMNRLYAFESTPNLVGAMADHRWTVRTSEVYAHAIAVAKALGVPGVDLATEIKVPQDHIDALARDLSANRGTSIVLAGDHQPIEVHALAYAINEFLGNVGQTVQFIPPADASAEMPDVFDLGALVQDLNAGSVDLLIVLEGNPVFDAPVDLNFAEAYQKAATRVHIGLYDDETSHFSQWHLPLTHPLEAWGDGRAFDGTLSVVQPIIAPLYEGKSAIEIFSNLLGRPQNGYDLVRETWRNYIRGDFERGWGKVLHDGVLARSNFAPARGLTPMAQSWPAVTPTTGLELAFQADPTIYDGRYANNGWLQELPKPLTKLTWDNVALMSPATAKRLGVVSDDMVELTIGERSLNMPVFVQPGMPNEQVTVNVGYGREVGGVVAIATPNENDSYGGGGYNAYALRTANAPYFEGNLNVRKLGYQEHLATTQGHQPIEGDRIPQVPGDHREVVVEHDLQTFNEHAAEIAEERGHTYDHLRKQNLYPEEIFVYDGPQWGMTIDLNTCIGCNACVTACQAENNIPVVGKEQVARHREMHWLRIDRYYSGEEMDADQPVAWQPIMCVHCEKAPCEPVCPVAATVHSHEGLNQMIYNRCVGTRYCSNNCPYKVRKFNYLNYTDNQKQFDTKLDEKPRIPLLKLLNNPNVTVRGRGVMEKCTYCVQRINSARIEAKKQNREIRDGEIVTACQQACPTKTIVFGNVADPESAVSQWRNDPRAYLLLQELQTRPRTSHLAKLRNPNPEIRTPEPAHLKPVSAETGGGH
jgi:molybdopterin-containing oxidoreductase family iron-sulfur binding subunit